MQDWSSSWTPPGFTPLDPNGSPTTQQDTGFDWSWFMEASGLHAWQTEAPGIARTVQGWFTQSPEDQLTQLILQKMGGGTLTGVAALQSGDPKAQTAEQRREQIAKDAAHRAMTDPAYRDQLAQSLGWNLKNPQVAHWLMNGGALPQNPTSAGPTTAATSTTAPPAGTQAATTLGAPFDPKAWKGRASDPGYTYGAVLSPAIAKAAGIDRQWGVDYALPLGTQLPSMFAGTIVEADFNGPYGNTVVVKQANGYTYRVAHLEAMNVHVGETVAVGQSLGLVGSTGNSTGPHVLIEMRDPEGHPIDPTPIIDSALKGDFSATTGAQKYMNDYITAASSAGPILTSDGHLIYPGSQDYNVFFAAQSLWRKRYGVDPPWSFLSGLIASGQTTTEQVQNAMDQMSSDISGLNWGARDALTNDANAAATKAWDRTVPDATIKQLAALGITTPGQIQGWIQSHPASSLEPGAYGQVFDALNGHTQALWQQPPSPELVKHVHDAMKAGPP